MLGQSAGFASLVQRYGIRLSLWSVVGLLLLSLLGSALMTYSARLDEQRIVTVVELGTMDRLIRHILSLSVGYFDRRTHGEIVQTIRQDVTQVRNVVLSSANMVLDALRAIALMVRRSASAPGWFWAFRSCRWPCCADLVVARKTLVRSFGIRRKSVAVFDMLLQLLHGNPHHQDLRSRKGGPIALLDRARGYFASWWP